MKARTHLIQKLQDELEKYFEIEGKIFELLGKFPNFPDDKQCECEYDESLDYNTFAYVDDNLAVSVCVKCGGWEVV